MERNEFPFLSQQRSDGVDLVYFDNAATTHKPRRVIDCETTFYKVFNGNPHRGGYGLAQRATGLYEQARNIVAEFVGAEMPEEIIFTKSATEASNMIASGFGMGRVGQEDEIALTIAEHHSSIVPWQRVAQKTGARLVYLEVDACGRVPQEELEEKLNSRTRVVVVSHVSNVLGTVMPLRDIAAQAHGHGAVVVFDCAQSVAHIPLDLASAGADFAFFSGHKVFGPQGCGVLYMRNEFFDEVEPFVFGGGMIDAVGRINATYTKGPQRFEGGSVNAAGACGLAEALTFMGHVGWGALQKREQELGAHLLERIRVVPDLEVFGNGEYSPDRCPVVSFSIKGIDPFTVARILDRDGIAVRAGALCAQPLMGYIGVPAVCRASLSFYNTEAEIDRFVQSLESVKERAWTEFYARR